MRRASIGDAIAFVGSSVRIDLDQCVARLDAGTARGESEQHTGSRCQ